MSSVYFFNGAIGIQCKDCASSNHPGDLVLTNHVRR